MIPNKRRTNNQRPTHHHSALIVFDDGRFDLSPEFPSDTARDTYLAVAMPRAARYAIPLRRSVTSLEWRSVGGEWIAARSPFDVPRPEVVGAKPRRAVISSRCVRTRRAA